jgi:hypothetical protein
MQGSAELSDAAITFLLSAEGEEWVRRAGELPGTERTRLADLTALRRGLSPEQAGAALEQAGLRRRATAKFRHAGLMLFTAAGLQQASGERAAEHRAGRFAGRRALDATCGIGGDALALAGTARRLFALDRDPGRLRLARHNLAACGRTAEFVAADALAPPLAPGVYDAVFCDPGRRGAEGRRIFRPEDFEPPLGAILQRYEAADLAVKVAPGIDYGPLLAGEGDRQVDEVEVVSVRGDVKEAVLWTRGLATPGVRRRASLLGAGVTLTDADAPDACPVTEPQAYIYEPDGAVIRAGLVRPLAALLGLAQIDPQIAYLTGPGAVATPFAQGFAVDEVHPFNLKALNRRLAELRVGVVELKKRGVAMEPEALRPRLKLEGASTRTVIFTRRDSGPIMLICRRLDAPTAPIDRGD